jgi:hypothetical protein
MIKSKDYRKWELSRESMNMLVKIQEDDELARQHMLPKETKEVLDKQYLLNYFSNQVESQIKQTLKYNYNDMCDHMVGVGMGQLDILNKSTHNWENFIDYFEKRPREPEDDDRPSEDAKQDQNDDEGEGDPELGHSLEPEKGIARSGSSNMRLEPDDQDYKDYDEQDNPFDSNADQSSDQEEAKYANHEVEPETSPLNNSEEYDPNDQSDDDQQDDEQQDEYKDEEQDEEVEKEGVNSNKTSQPVDPDLTSKPNGDTDAKVDDAKVDAKVDEKDGGGKKEDGK